MPFFGSTLESSLNGEKRFSVTREVEKSQGKISADRIYLMVVINPNTPQPKSFKSFVFGS